MRNPKISAARAARAQYKQYLRKLADRARDARTMYSIALKELAIDKFIKLHPQANWPEWMERRAEYRVKFDESACCKVSIVVPVDGLMPENYFWQDGHLARRLNDGSIGIVICGGPPAQESITVFEAHVDPESLAVTVIIDNDPATMVLPPPEYFYDRWK
jgi:hypothetical protein